MKRSLTFLTSSAVLLAACSSGQTAATHDDTTTRDPSFTPAETTAPPEVTVRSARVVGSVEPRVLAAASASTPAFAHDPEFYDELRDEMEEIATRPLATAPQAPTAPATVTPSNVATTLSGAAFGFPGLAVSDSDTATKGKGVTPPDQGLCVGNGYVVEAVNDALAIYDILGGADSTPISLASFFAFPADPDATHGSFSSDPKCYFDPSTSRFFATVLRVTWTVDAAGQQHTSGSKLDIATSTSNDPRGKWNVFEIDGDDDGTGGSPNHAHCPCLGDQPLLGVDANGVYVTTNEFGTDSKLPGFNGAQIYAVSKSALIAGTAPKVVQLANLVLANSVGYSIQPATSPSGTIDGANGGTEYFLSSLDPDGTLDNRIALWSLSNTRSLDGASPSLVLEHAILASETYGQAPPATQKFGPTPLKDCLAAGTCQDYPGVTITTNTLEQLDSGDDRMNQVVYADGRLWGALNSVVQVNGQAHTGAAWFSVVPKHVANGHIAGKVQSQGYVAIANNDILYPSIALRDDGVGAIAFSVSGADYWPSTGFARFDAKKGAGDVQIAGAGAGPLDDFSGYVTKPKSRRPQGPARFGDYSAALVDGDTLWMSNELVPNACAAYPCDGRDRRTNWGTFVTRLDLDDTIE